MVDCVVVVVITGGSGAVMVGPSPRDTLTGRHMGGLWGWVDAERVRRRGSFQAYSGEKRKRASVTFQKDVVKQRTKAFTNRQNESF